MRAVLTSLAFFLTVGAAGCGPRDHLVPSYGRAYREAFAVQVQEPKAAQKPHSVAGLDPQEAKIINRTYRRDLAGKQAQATGTGGDAAWFVAPQGPGLPPATGMMPPPSVPPHQGEY